MCRAVSCPDDDNPCTQEMVAADGECYPVPNYECTEALSDLQRLYRGAQSYYGTWFYDEGKWKPQPLQLGTHAPLVAGLTPEEGTCCWSLGGPDLNKDDFCDNAEGVGLDFYGWNWRFIDFRPIEPHRFVYSFSETGDGSPKQTLFEARVIADLDCDGKSGTFVVKGQFGKDLVAGYEAATWPWKYQSNLGLPKNVQYFSEDGEQSFAISSTWPVGSPTLKQLSQAYAILTQDSYLGRFKEALGNMLRIDVGAKVYYNSPKAMSGAPTCQIEAEDQPLLDTWGTHLPTYYPLMQSLTPVDGPCCPGSGYDDDGDGLCDPDANIWMDPSWVALQFSIYGPHEFVYNFKELKDDGGPSGYKVQAYRSVGCAGYTEALNMLGELESQGACEVVRNPVFEYSPYQSGLGKRSVGIRIDPGDSWYMSLIDVLGAEGYPVAPQPYEANHLEAFYYLSDMQDAISSYWESNCDLPALPDKTPNAWDCCAASVDADEDGYCDANPDAWSHEFWTGIGFQIGKKHRYRFEFESNEMNPNHTLLTIKAHGNGPKCGGGDGLSFHLYGVASSIAGQCTVAWFKGYNPGIWYK